MYFYIHQRKKMLQTAVRDIKSAIGDICISMHRKSKEDEVVKNLRAINSHLFMLSIDMFKYTKNIKDVEKIKNDVETFFMEMIIIDKFKTEPYDQILKDYLENIKTIKNRLELIYKFMQVKNADEVFFEHLISEHIKGNL